MDRAIRLVVGQISHETNTFSPIRTGLSEFSERGRHYGEEMFAVYAGTKTAVAGFMDASKDIMDRTGLRIELIPTVAASATPSGTVTGEAYDHLLGKLVEGIEQAKRNGGLDGVVLALHGAMVAEGASDAEGDILEKVRQAVGPSVPVVASLDLHGNISPKMVANADAFFGFNTNPHVDPYERAVEATLCVVDIITGKLKPTMALEKRPMMAPTINMRTAEGPMVHLFEMAYAFEKDPRVVNVSVFGGFPFADIPEVGLAVIAVTNDDLTFAQHIAKTIADEAWKIREEFLKPIVPVEEAARYAMSPEAQAKGKPGPIILADVADNCGGGGSGDTPLLLRTLLEMGAKDVGFAIMYDPEVAQIAHKAGVGATIEVDLGGKVVSEHGKPVHVKALVKKLTDGTFRNTGPMATGLEVSVGPTALLEAGRADGVGGAGGVGGGGGVDIIVISQRSAPNDPEIFRHVGIDPAKKKVLVVKSRGHFRAGYEPFAKEIVEVDCPGMASPNLKWFTYKHVPRPLWPLEE